jgi:hypothetical protein
LRRGAGALAAKAPVFQPFPLDLVESRRYIRDTLRQAVSFACSERPARQSLEIIDFSQVSSAQTPRPMKLRRCR